MHIFILTRGYPAPDRLYNHAFVHSRVLAYRRLGHEVTVCWLRNKRATLDYCFDGVAVTVGPPAHCLAAINAAQPDVIAAHAIADDFDPVISNVPASIPINGWIYGSEIMAFHRVTEREADDALRWQKARDTFERRITYWRKLVTEWPANLRLVFVSHHAASEAAHNVGAPIPRWAVCPSPIDTDLFSAPPKNENDRFQILSIRPFSDWRYANDLSVKAIELMRNDPAFSQFSFRFIGEGHLFDKILAPIRNLPNVHCQEHFLTMEQIAQTQRNAGVFLTPSRDDAQGVARDQAMSSGLVAISNHAGAVPEFLDNDCGLLCPPEDHKCMAHGMLEMAHDPKLYLRRSAAAAERIRKVLAMDTIIPREIRLLAG